MANKKTVHTIELKIDTKEGQKALRKLAYIIKNFEKYSDPRGIYKLVSAFSIFSKVMQEMPQDIKLKLGLNSQDFKNKLEQTKRLIAEYKKETGGLMPNKFENLNNVDKSFNTRVTGKLLGKNSKETFETVNKLSQDIKIANKVLSKADEKLAQITG